MHLPVQWKASGAVLGLLELHASLVITVVIMFLMGSKMSLLEHTCQDVSQVMPTDTAEAVYHSAKTADRGQRCNEGEKVADSRIQISLNVHAGRVEVTAVRQQKGATYSAPVGDV